MSTVRYKPILDLTVSYKSLWVVFCVVVTLVVAGWFAYERFKPAGPDERAKQELSKAQRFSARAKTCLSESVGPDLIAKLREGDGFLKDAQAYFDEGNFAATEEAAREARDLLREFNDATCATATSVADFIEIKGRIEVKKVKSPKWVPAARGTRLQAGDRIKVHRGKGKIRYKSGEEVALFADSLIEIVAYEPKADGRGRAQTKMESGEIEATGRSGTRSVLETPAGRLDLNADRVNVSETEDGKVRARSLGGGGAVAHVGDQKLELEKGTELVAEKGRNGWDTAGVREYLPAPELTRPVKGRVFTSEVPTKELTVFRWREIEGVKKFLFSISPNEFFDPLLNTRHREVPRGKVDKSFEAEILGLPPGTYYWTVSAVDSEGEGERSEVRKFTVQQGAADPDAVPPTLEISRTQKMGDKILLEGRTDPYVRVEAFVNDEFWGDLSLNVDGSFRAMIPFAIDGNNTFRIEAQDTQGTTAEEQFEIYWEY